MERKNLKELKLEFQTFLTNIRYNLDIISDLLEIENITFSFDEIDRVKRLFESNYIKPEIIGLNYNELTNAFYSYVGEAFIHYHGGNGELSTMKNDEAYGTPIIVNWGGDNYPWVRISPWVWKTLIEQRKLRGKLSEKLSEKLG